jgi:hypothetical protein
MPIDQRSPRCPQCHAGSATPVWEQLPDLQVRDGVWRRVYTVIQLLYRMFITITFGRKSRRCAHCEASLTRDFR